MGGETGEKVEGRPGLHPEFGSPPHFSSSRFPGNLSDPQGFFGFSSPLRKILVSSSLPHVLRVIKSRRGEGRLKPDLHPPDKPPGGTRGVHKKEDTLLRTYQKSDFFISSPREIMFSSSVSVILILTSMESMSSGNCRITTYIRQMTNCWITVMLPDTTIMYPSNAIECSRKGISLILHRGDLQEHGMAAQVDPP
jgi:hypothetical protein